MTQQKSALSIAISFALTSLTGFAHAETIAMEEMVVSASGYDQTTVDAPASITVIDAQQISQGAYKDVVDVLAHVPGVFATGGASGKDISIRGMPSKYTLLLVDGRPQSSRESQPNGGGGLDQEWLPPLQSIEQIEVIRGPMSTLYGSNAMGGVVNIITKKVNDNWQGSLRTQVSIPEDSQYGKARQGELYLSGPVIQDKLNLTFGARYLEQDEDDVARGTPEKALQNYHAKVNYLLSNNHDFELAMMHSEQTRTSRVGHSAAGSARSDSETDNDKTSFSITHHGQWEEVEDTTDLQHETTRNNGRDIEITNTVFDSRWVLPSDEHITTLGVGASHASLIDNDTNDTSDLNSLSNDQYSVYAEDEWFLADSVTLTTGARLDKNEHYDAEVSPRVFANWYLDPQWVIKAGIATGYRAPELRQMTPEWGQESRGGDIYGNSDLQAETSLSKEIGVTYQNADFTATATLFDNRFDDKIITTDCPSSLCSDEDARYYTNVDKAKTQGFELSAKNRLTNTLEAHLTYTYTKSEQLSGDNKGKPLTQMPLHLFAASLDWQVNDQLKSWVTYEFRGKESQDTGLSSNTETQAPSYSMIDLGLQYHLSEHFILQAGIDNATDETFSFDEYGFVDASRTYWGSAEYRF